MTGQVEILIEPDGGVFLTGDQGRWDGLRVRYRAAGTRRWSKFIVVGEDGQSLLDLLVAAITVVERSQEHFDGRAIEGVQLELGGALA